VVQIETEDAVDRIDEILSVDGVDGVYVGPNDLAASLGLAPTSEPHESIHLDAIAKVQEACVRHRVKAGIHCGSVEYAKRWYEAGFEMLQVGNDMGFIKQSAAELFAQLASELPIAKRGSGSK
jgi:4-hydroxy-2-oxoheptanedioate aldolase